MDSCCYSRPFDVQVQARIHSESEAVLTVILHYILGQCVLVGSPILSVELQQPKALLLYSIVRDVVAYNSNIQDRARWICRQANIQTMDSLHLACAEAGNADVFLTTDDRLLKACAKASLSVRTMNPVAYVAEVLGDD